MDNLVNVKPVAIRAIEDFLENRSIQEVEREGTWIKVLNEKLVETEPGRITHLKKGRYYMAIKDDGVWVKFIKKDGKEGFLKMNPDDIELIKKN